MKNRINVILSTLNFVLCLVGYQLISVIFLPPGSHHDELTEVSQVITIPYRAITLVLAAIVIINNIGAKIRLSKHSVLFVIYWLLFLMRIFYDMYVRYDVFVSSEVKGRILLYSVFLCFFIGISVLLSFQSIDFRSALKYVYPLIVLTILISFISNYIIAPTDIDSDTRLDANIAFNTISYGHFGAMGFLLTLYHYISDGRFRSVLYKLGLVFIAFISLFVVLRAGSRGPLLTLFLVLIVFIVLRSKNRITGSIVLISVFILVVIFMPQIISIIGVISPVMQDRILESLIEGDVSYRDIIYRDALTLFSQNPVTGYGFTLFQTDGYPIYPHNIILESFLALGVVGGLFFVYLIFNAVRIAFVNIKNFNGYTWVSLLLLQSVFSCMTSGAFYFEPLLTVLLIVIYQSEVYNSTNEYVV